MIVQNSHCNQKGFSIILIHDLLQKAKIFSGLNREVFGKETLGDEDEFSIPIYQLSYFLIWNAGFSGS